MTFKKHNPELLLIPPFPLTFHQDIEKNKSFIPVGLLSLLGSLLSNGFDAQLYKTTVYLEKLHDYNTVAEDILTYQPKIIGFSTWCNTYPYVIQLCREIKNLNPDVPIILGGPQASVLDIKTIKRFPFIDFVLRGEADYSIVQLLTFLLKNNYQNRLEEISGLTFRDKNHKIVANSYNRIEKDLNKLPIPAYQEIPNLAGNRIDAGRGCPFSCTYCTTNQFFSKSYRVKSPERIIKEVDTCFIQSGSTSFGFAHDMITLNKKFMISLCKKLRAHYKSTGRKYTWSCSARTDCVSADLLKLMAKAGCEAIFFGIESGSERIRKIIKKDIDLDQAYEMVSAASINMMKPVVSYMTGFPGETKEDLEATLRSVIKMTVLGAKPQMTMLSILPGTPLFSQYFDQLEYDGNFSGFTSNYLSDVEIQLVKTHPDLFSSFYYLPNKDLSRNLLNFVVNLVNYIPDFMPTFTILRNFILNDISKIKLTDYLEAKMSDFINDPEMHTPEYFFLADSIKTYLKYLENKELPVYASDFFYIDCVKAFLRIKYLILHEDFPLHNKDIKSKTYDKNADGLELYLFQEVVTTDYDISNISLNSENEELKTKLRKGKFKFLVIAKTHKRSVVYKITKKEAEILKNSQELHYSDYIDKNKIKFQKSASWKRIKRLVDIGALIE